MRVSRVLFYAMALLLPAANIGLSPSSSGANVLEPFIGALAVVFVVEMYASGFRSRWPGAFTGPMVVIAIGVAASDVWDAPPRWDLVRHTLFEPGLLVAVGCSVLWERKHCKRALRLVVLGALFGGVVQYALIQSTQGVHTWSLPHALSSMRTSLALLVPCGAIIVAQQATGRVPVHMIAQWRILYLSLASVAMLGLALIISPSPGTKGVGLVGTLGLLWLALRTYRWVAHTGRADVAPMAAGAGAGVVTAALGIIAVPTLLVPASALLLGIMCAVLATCSRLARVRLRALAHLPSIAADIEAAELPMPADIPRRTGRYTPASDTASRGVHGTMNGL